MGARFPAPVQTGLVAHPASCTMSTGSFPGVKCGQGVTQTPHHLLVPWSRKSRAIPLPNLWAVQSLSACTGVTIYLFFYSLQLSSQKIYSYIGKKYWRGIPSQNMPMAKWSWCRVASSVISTGEFPNAKTNRKLKRTNSRPSNVTNI